MAMAIGVLDLQGAVREHVWALKRLDVEARRVKRSADLAGLAGLIVPGGESTTIGMLAQEYGLIAAVRAEATQGMAVMGTCAGLILLAKTVAGREQPTFGLMNIIAKRNAFGRQRESFEAPLSVPALGADPVPAVFIRAPYIEAVGHGVAVLGTYQDKIVLARQANCLASAFHPELTQDLRLHQYFLEVAAGTR
ncbi:MAG: pyridoxal 5'-phosphate synthase glutaminase subunit PdxT [Bacillota bacterium]